MKLFLMAGAIPALFPLVSASLTPPKPVQISARPAATSCDFLSNITASSYDLASDGDIDGLLGVLRVKAQALGANYVQLEDSKIFSIRITDASARIAAIYVGSAYACQKDSTR